MENVVEGQGWEDGDLKTLGKMPFFSPPNLGRTSKVCRKVEDLLSGFSGAFTTRASWFPLWGRNLTIQGLTLAVLIRLLEEVDVWILVEVATQASSEELGRAVGASRLLPFFSSRKAERLIHWCSSCCEGFLFSDKVWNRQVSGIDHSWWPSSFTPSPNFVEFHILVDFLQYFLGCNHASCVFPISCKVVTI